MKFINHFCKSLSFSIVIMFFLIVSILGCGTERFENSKKLLEKMTPKIPSLSPEDVVDKIAIFPNLENPDIWVPVLLVPIAVQWWASYYPGAEPGGGGYIAQRMLSAKNESHSLGATLLFNIAHYAIRPWPWIIVALVSIVSYPELSDPEKGM